MADDFWIGWLVDGLGHRNDEIFTRLEQAIHNRNIPMHGNRGREESVSVSTGEVDMWWRRDSKQLTVTSELDGKVIAKVVSQDYGTSLWVAILFEMKAGDFGENWAKSMAWAAFQETLERVVREAIVEVAGDNTITNVSDPRKSNG